MIFGREPVMIMAVVQAVIGFAVAFGADLTDVQMASVTGLAATVLGLIARQNVTPD